MKDTVYLVFHDGGQDYESHLFPTKDEAKEYVDNFLSFVREKHPLVVKEETRTFYHYHDKEGFLCIEEKEIDNFTVKNKYFVLVQEQVTDPFFVTRVFSSKLKAQNAMKVQMANLLVYHLGEMNAEKVYDALLFSNRNGFGGFYFPSLPDAPSVALRPCIQHAVEEIR